MTDRIRRALDAFPADAAPPPAGIHRIALPTPFAVGRINAYLLEGDPLTLVDTGVNTGASLDVLEAALAQLGHRIEDLELLVLTHEHFDHLGLGEVIAGRSECQVAAFAGLAPLHAPDADRSAILAARLAWASGQLRRGGYPDLLVTATEGTMGLAVALGSRPAVDIELADGDTLRAGGRDFEILHRPGHSLSDLVLADRSDGTAIVGDHVLAAMSPNPTLSAPHDVLLPDASTPRARSLPLYLDSVRRTADDRHRLLLPGHGPTLGPPAELIASRLLFHERRAEKIAHGLGDEPRTVFEVATGLWRDVPVSQPLLTHSEVIGHLDVLQDAGRVTVVAGGEGEPDGYLAA